jgi:hypothetical protein
MSRKRRQKPLVNGRSASERFSKLPHYMQKSEAWRTMSPNAKAIYLEVLLRYDGGNNGEISYSVREASTIGIGRTAAANALKELRERGFLVIHRDSSFHVKSREARCWRLTALECGNALATKDFMRWRPGGTGQNKTQTVLTD